MSNAIWQTGNDMQRPSAIIRKGTTPAVSRLPFLFKVGDKREVLVAVVEVFSSHTPDEDRKSVV